jgi:NadR type nicotinamide-nucleotide adenylyltransferase
MENRLYKIVVTGPESTGKTELATFLAGAFGGTCIPEYARAYVEKLDRRYTYSDVEHIAAVQAWQFSEAVRGKTGIVFLDTYLVITKVWFQEVFGKMPDWIDRKIRESGIDLFLLCYHDLEWIADPVRENPGARREYLFNRYREEIEALGRPFELVRGSGEERFENARRAVLKHFPHLERSAT